MRLLFAANCALRGKKNHWTMFVFKCQLATSVWFAICSWLDVKFSTWDGSKIGLRSFLSTVPPGRRDVWQYFWHGTIWFSWKVRNKVMLKGEFKLAKRYSGANQVWCLVMGKKQESDHNWMRVCGLGGLSERSTELYLSCVAGWESPSFVLYFVVTRVWSSGFSCWSVNLASIVWILLLVFYWMPLR